MSSRSRMKNSQREITRRNEDRSRREHEWSLKLSDLKAFSTYTVKMSQLSAKAYIRLLEREATVAGIPMVESKKVIPFVLKDSALYWYQSNIKRDSGITMSSKQHFYSNINLKG